MNFIAEKTIQTLDDSLNLGLKFVGILCKDEVLYMTCKLVVVDKGDNVIFETEVLEVQLGQILNLQVSCELTNKGNRHD